MAREEQRSEVPRWRAWRNPPGVVWLVALAAALATMLWAVTYPGFASVPMLIALLGMLVLGSIWLVRLIGWVIDRDRRDAWRWCAAPLMVVLTGVLVVTDVPLRVRFELARDDFDRVVEDLPARGSFDAWAPLSVPDSVGGYEIVRAYQVGEMVILYEGEGLAFHDAGFAYLPSGPDDRLGNGSFEAPRFQSLGGRWYAWRASW